MQVALGRLPTERIYEVLAEVVSDEIARKTKLSLIQEQALNVPLQQVKKKIYR